MERPSLLVLLRHAESERNKIKRGAVYFQNEYDRTTVKGIPDYQIPITDQGASQAAKTGEGLRDDFGTFYYIYHSGYLRTKQTMEGVLGAYAPEEQEKMRAKIRMDPFIRERDPGYCYDMTQEEAEHNFPWLKDYWKTFGGFFGQPPGGESLAQMTNRVYLFVNMLFRDRGGKKILVVTHGGTLRCFRFILERWDYNQALKWPPGESPKNCSLTIYDYNSSLSKLVLREHNKVYW